VRLVAYAGRELRGRSGIRSSGTQIQPVTVGSDAWAMKPSRALQLHGFDIHAMRPPTVSEGTARLHVLVTLNAGAQIVSGASVSRQ
jgi:8-amino-7-oxononanoate synthase